MAIKKAVAAFAFAAILGICAYAFLNFIASGDIENLEKFEADYKNFDAAVLGQAVSEAGDALDLLKSTAKVRLSSAIKNDGCLMQTEHQIVDIAGQEFDHLGTYKVAIQNQVVDVGALARSLDDVTAQRKSAYALFRHLISAPPRASC